MLEVIAVNDIQSFLFKNEDVLNALKDRANSLDYNKTPIDGRFEEATNWFNEIIWKNPDINPIVLSYALSMLFGINGQIFKHIQDSLKNMMPAIANNRNHGIRAENAYRRQLTDSVIQDRLDNNLERYVSKGEEGEELYKDLLYLKFYRTINCMTVNKAAPPVLEEVVSETESSQDTKNQSWNLLSKLKACEV